LDVYRAAVPPLFGIKALFQGVAVDNEQFGWPFYLVRACLLGNIRAFKSMLKQTPLSCIDQANVDVRSAFCSKNIHSHAWLWRVSNWIDTSLLHLVCPIPDLNLARGVTTSILDRRGESPFHVAVGDVAVIGAFLNAGTDISIRHRSSCHYLGPEETPLHYAIRRDLTSAAQFLIEKGADTFAMGHSGSPLDMAASRSNTTAILDCLLDTTSYD
jgi:hypothetical protein